ncbi:DNA adenine methylase [Kitasatospora sp. NPDC094016]|uniref:DNA adenine methylase n=1 Tax=Kitasatospora sp. NPDC094016 TaxID=3154986 RepID=UPI003327CE16
MRYISPLRYPGGKARLAPFISQLIAQQNPRPRYYAEPFAGGAGSALRLLIDKSVERIYINDLDPGIAAFWRCVFQDGQEFIKMIHSEEISIDAWKHHVSVYGSPEGKSDRELGFATFFLNRCNRSGILRARPIGGLDQSGKWKIDARFNREALAERVKHLGDFSASVTLAESDARDFIRDLEMHGTEVLLYVDPPYLIQGDRLYLDSLTRDDHAELAEVLRNTNLHWLLTYDADERVTEELYKGFRCAEFSIFHTAQIQRMGVEYAVFSDSVALPDVSGIIGDDNFRLVG